MILEKIKEDELQFMERFYTPQCLIESLFHNFDNLASFDKEKFGSLRVYQYPLISSEALIDTNIKGLTEKEKFSLRKGAGDTFCFGARKFGKTMCVEELDLVNDGLTSPGEPVAFSSVDLIHIRAVLDKIKKAFEDHKICKLWKRRITGAPDYKIELKTGYEINSVNFNLNSKDPGKQWYGKHVKRAYIEEASLETEKVYEKRKDALSELGAVFRVSGMTNFTKFSPSGRMFYDPENKAKVINLPQYVNPLWDEKEKNERMKEYGGETSIGYRIFVKGEVVEDGVSEFDMERVEKCFKRKKSIKRFEINKDRYKRFKDFIIVDRPVNAERLFLCADIGESAGTEIIILSEVEKKYIYLYNIVLYNLTHLQQTEIFKWLAETLSVNVIGIDCGDGTGRAIYSNLEKLFSSENLVWYDGSRKIDVDFEKDDKGNIILKKGKPVYRQEYMSEWSVRRLKHLLYENRCIFPTDYKLERQLSSVISVQSGSRTLYDCVAESGDHLFDAFRVFSIAQWLMSDFNKTKPIRKKTPDIGAVNW